MKNNLLYAILSGFMLIIVSESCYKYPEVQHDYFEQYKRVIGPKGGTINYYANYDDDSKDEIIATLEFPQGALDSAMVFNIYQYEDYKLAKMLKTGFVILGSKLLYFVPFPESEGYNEESQFDINYHLSVEFNKPVTITYHYLSGKIDYSLDDFERSTLYYKYYNSINRAYKLYRIKIPKTDEWGEANNIFIEWNSQGYPVGYNQSELQLIVSGVWSQSHPEQNGKINLQNWEEVTDFQINIFDESVSFEINDTDYMYVLAQVIQVNTEDLPSRIQWHVNNTFTQPYIESAAFFDKKYYVNLSNNFMLEYTQRGDFLKYTLEMYSFSQVNQEVRDSIRKHYPDNKIKYIGYILDNKDRSFYKIVLSGGISVLIDGLGNVINMYIYGYDETELPPNVKSYIETNHPSSAIINIVLKTKEFVVYLSDNKKLFFDFSGSWNKTIWYRYDKEILPEAIKTYMDKNFNNISELAINQTTDSDGTFYELLLINENYIEFSEAGVLQYFEIPYFDEDELPQAVKDSSDAFIPSALISNIEHYYDVDKEVNNEYYDFYYLNKMNVEYLPTGKKIYVYCEIIEYLDPKIRENITDNYPNFEIMNFELYYDDEDTAYYIWVTLRNKTNSNFIGAVFNLGGELQWVETKKQQAGKHYRTKLKNKQKKHENKTTDPINYSSHKF